MSGFTLPENCHVVGILKPAADAAGRTGRYVSLKNLVRAWIVVYIDQGNAATVLLSPKQATAVAGTGSKVLTNAVPIWANNDVAALDLLVRQSDAVNFTPDAAVKEKQVVFQINPAMLDAAGGFDCIGLTTGASNAANITSAMVIGEARYAGDALPTIASD